MSVNQVILVGRLGKDIKLEYTPDQQAVAKFSLATSSSYKDKKTDKWVDQTEWHNVVLWGKRAETLQQYCQKGSWLSVEGKITTRSWDDKKTGDKRYATEIKATKVNFYTDKKNPDQARHTNGPSDLPNSPVDQNDINSALGF